MNSAIRILPSRKVGAASSFIPHDPKSYLGGAGLIVGLRARLLLGRGCSRRRRRFRWTIAVVTETKVLERVRRHQIPVAADAVSRGQKKLFWAMGARSDAAEAV